MNEKDIDEQINISEQKENISSTKKNQKTEPESIFIVVIHLPNHKSFSFEVPQTWNTKKLLTFITTTFKTEFKKSSPVFIFHGNTLSSFSESPLKDYFQVGKINHIVITLKKISQENPEENNQNNINLKTNKDVFKTDEFCEMEKNAIDDYIKIFQNNTINTFPLMNPAYNHRREQIKINSALEKIAAFEPVPLEEFPTRNYFQLNIIFKCFISFFAFGIYIKGFNFILFLSVLIGYYWYCINNVVEEFYKKKIDEIGITEEEYRNIKNGGIYKIRGLNNRKGLFIFENEKDNEEDKQKNKEDKNIHEKTNNIQPSSNINREANLININLEEDVKDEDKKEKNEDNKGKKFNLGNINNTNNLIQEDVKDLNNNNNIKSDNLYNLHNNFGTENNNKINFQNNDNNINNNIFKNNNNNINNIFNNNNNIENKDKNEKKEENEVRPEPLIRVVFEIIRVFFISLIPSLCDEFEANNPMPSNNRNQNNEEENNDDNNENDNIENNNNINNDNNDINIRNGPENQEDDSNNNKKVTSSKVVNMSEDSNRDNGIYKLIKKDNQSTNENEYVFSENGGIDSLSMNSELFKQKREKEKEKEKDKEKEKQIFEEDEEYLIEEEKKKKDD